MARNTYLSWAFVQNVVTKNSEWSWEKELLYLASVVGNNMSVNRGRGMSVINAGIAFV